MNNKIKDYWDSLMMSGLGPDKIKIDIIIKIEIWEEKLMNCSLQSKGLEKILLITLTVKKVFLRLREIEWADKLWL